MEDEGRHFHIIVWASEGKNDKGEYIEVTRLDLIVQSTQEALRKAKEMVPEKKIFRINDIIEHHGRKEIPDG